MDRLAERLLAALALVALLLVCFRGRVPPLVIFEHFEVPEDWGEPVEVTARPGTVLRGSFRESYAGAPVVLILQQADARWLRMTHGLVSQRGLAERLTDLGFSALALDYTGIGSSDGRPSPAHLERDARAIWDEAVRRADGRAERVVIYAASLGTLAASALLVEGARPAAVILVAPILRDTALTRGARALHGPAAEALVAWFLAPLGPVDLRDALPGCTAELLVQAGSRDEFTSAGERDSLRRSVEAAGGRWMELERNHIRTIHDAADLPREAVELLLGLGLAEHSAEPRLSEVLARLPPEVAERFHRDPQAMERLCQLACLDRRGDPLVVAAAAWVRADPVDALLGCWSTGPWRLVEGFGETPPFQPSQVRKSFEELVYQLDRSDPCGPLPDYARGGLTLLLPASDLSANIEQQVARQGRHPVGRSDPNWMRAGVCADSQGHQARRYARVLLKHWGIPERLRLGDEGEPVLEVLDGFTWRPFDFTPGDLRPGARLD